GASENNLCASFPTSAWCAKTPGGKPQARRLFSDAPTTDKPAASVESKIFFMRELCLRSRVALSPRSQKGVKELSENKPPTPAKRNHLAGFVTSSFRLPRSANRSN